MGEVSPLYKDILFENITTSALAGVGYQTQVAIPVRERKEGHK